MGRGPRDGLMTGLVKRTGGSVRLIRTGIEVAVVAIGFLLGGTLGIGTVLYAVGVGPLIQLFVRRTRLAANLTPAAPSAIENQVDTLAACDSES